MKGKFELNNFLAAFVGIDELNEWIKTVSSIKYGKLNTLVQFNTTVKQLPTKYENNNSILQICKVTDCLYIKIKME